MTRWEYARNLGEEPPGRSFEPRLLPGEDPNTDLLEDVTHWVSVYAELLDSGRGLMVRGQDVPPGVDDKLVKAQLRRLEGRLDFWLQKRALLNP